jgi:hypothetical protein
VRSAKQVAGQPDGVHAIPDRDAHLDGHLETAEPIAGRTPSPGEITNNHPEPAIDPDGAWVSKLLAKENRRRK